MDEWKYRPDISRMCMQCCLKLLRRLENDWRFLTPPCGIGNIPNQYSRIPFFQIRFRGESPDSLTNHSVQKQEPANTKVVNEFWQNLQQDDEQNRLKECEDVRKHKLRLALESSVDQQQGGDNQKPSEKYQTNVDTEHSFGRVDENIKINIFNFHLEDHFRGHNFLTVVNFIVPLVFGDGWILVVLIVVNRGILDGGNCCFNDFRCDIRYVSII